MANREDTIVIEKKDIESPDLLNYLREEITIDEIKNIESPKRLNSIDFVKGFSIIFIILAHYAEPWFNTDWLFLWGIVFAFLDILGPTMFVFLSALSVIFTIKRKENQLSQNAIRDRIFSRGLSIILIGGVFNILFYGGGTIFPLNFWGWNILFFIGFSQIFSYYALKVGKIPRVIIGVILLQYGPNIREFFYYNRGDNIFYSIIDFIINSPVPQLPVLPYISICFISTIFGEYLYEAMIIGTDEALRKLFKMFFYSGIFLICAGIFFGFRLETPYTVDPALYPHVGLFTSANTNPFIPLGRYPGMPAFLIRAYSSNLWYNIGFAIFIMGIALYYIDIKKKDNLFIKMVIFYGKISLSLFLILFVFLGLFYRAFEIWFFAFTYIAFTGFLGFLMYVWIKYFNGVGSPEWLMIQIGKITQKTDEEITKTSKKVYKKTKEGIQKTEEFIKGKHKKNKKDSVS
ncbi:MAG: hypothetical protein ACQERB_10210 [Promethearchaeati archaeon]